MAASSYLSDGYIPLRRALGWWVVVLWALALGGCGPRFRVEELNNSEKWKQVDFPDAPFMLSPVLSVLTWRHAIPPEVFVHFETTYGVKLRVEYISENEELHDRISQPNARYDLVMPGTYMVQQLIREKRLRRLDRERIPNLRHIGSDYYHLAFDPGLNYSAPIYHSTAGLALNVKYASGLPLSWGEFTSETGHALARGRIAVLDEMRTTLGVALLMLGHSPSTHNPAEIARARDLLLGAKAETGLAFDVNTMADILAREDAIMAVAWTGDAARALSANGYVRFIVPRGSSISELDSFCVLADSRHAETAEFFINYLLTPEVTAALTNYSHRGNTSAASLAFVNAAIRNGPGYMMPLLNNVVFLEDVNGAAVYYRDAWRAVKEAPSPEIDKVPLPFPRTQSTSVP